jgi:nucleoside-diphosphate-sugar epimerase
VEKKSVLLTGGAGFIGTHLADALKEKYDIIIYDALRRDTLSFFPHLKHHPSVKIIVGDVLNYDYLKASMNGVFAVIHLASIAGVSSYYQESFRTLRVNILGTINVLDAMLHSGTKMIIDFSTSEVYGVDANNVDEEHLHGIGPVSQKRWVYAVSKLASEHLTLRFAEEYNLQGICVRPFNIYGPGQTGEGAIRNFVLSLIAGKPIVIYGNGTDVRAWCYIDDLVHSVITMLETPEAIGMVFNIGNPSQAINTRDLAAMIIRLYGSGSITYAATEHAPIRLRIPNINRARAILGFEPKVSLEEGLKRTLQWYQRETGL